MDANWSIEKAIEKARREGRIISETKPVNLPGPTPTPERSAKKVKRELLPAAFVQPATWLVPVYCYAGDNARGFKKQIGRAGHERRPVYHTLARQLRALAPFADAAQAGRTVRITLTRIGGNKMDAANVVAALKYVQDAVADLLGVDDGKECLDWEYGQAPGRRKHGVRIQLELTDVQGQIEAVEAETAKR